MSAALETLPPDQRAVLQLILKQGRGYAELSGLLKIDEAAVRARAHAGLEALAPNGAGAALSAERRAQIADWMLGQQSDAERAVTLQHLEDSRAARRWATALRAQLEPVARAHELPELPAGRNGAAPVLAPEPAAPAEPVAQAAPASAPAPTARDFEREPRRASKLGGALLLAGVAALIAVVLIVVLNGGDDEEPASTPAAQTTAQQRRPATGTSDTPTVLQQVNLYPPGGRAASDARGIAFIMLQGQRPVVAVQTSRVDPNSVDDVYAVWLTSRATGRARFLGYVPGFVRDERRFTVTASLPRDTASYDQVTVSREATGADEVPGSPTDVVLVGTLRVNRAG